MSERAGSGRNENTAARATVKQLDEIRAELKEIAGELPLSDAQMCVLSARDSLGMAQDLIEADSDV